MRHTPDLLAGERIHGNGGVMRCGVDHTILDYRERLGATVVGHGIRPHRHQLLDVGLVDAGQRAVTLAGVAHAVHQHIARCLVIVEQILRSLRHCRCSRQHSRSRRDDRREQQFFHDGLPLFMSLAELADAMDLTMQQGDATRRECSAGKSLIAKGNQ